MEFTGERYVPGQGGAQIAYEHLHRYLFAARWAAGKLVLDAAAGAGYGAALLARSAAAAWALEIDAAAVASGRAAYARPNLRFIQGDATRLPFRSGSVDLVTAFEVLEHLADPEGLVREIARVCRRDGLALISTPNKAVYSEARDYHNPFHMREFYREEFLTLLCASFRNVVLFHQQIRAGSLISSEGGDGWELHAEPPPGAGRGPVEPMYFLALCGNEPFRERLPRGSAYLDPTDALIAEWGAEAARLNGDIERLGSWGKALETELARRDETLRRTLDEVGERDRTIESLQQEMGNEIGARDRSLAALRREFEERSRWAGELQQDVADRDALLRRTTEALDRTDAELKGTEARLARIRRAFLHRVLCRLGLLPR